MTTSDASGFANLVPGFDFLQGLMTSAGAAMPNIGQWVAPTLDPAELEKRIGELRTVQFWLEQNARLLDTTIQALEVQRMTIATLKTMNVQMGDLRESLKVRVPPGGFGASAPAAAPAAPSWFSPPAAAPSSEAPSSEAAASEASAPAPTAAGAPSGDGAAAGPGVVDPMQWWGALTQQFTQLAANAVDGGGAESAKTLAARTLQQSFEAAGDAFRKALPAGFGGASAPPLRKPPPSRASPKGPGSKPAAAKRGSTRAATTRAATPRGTPKKAAGR